MESTQQSVLANRLSVVWTFVLGISGFVIFLGLTVLLVRLFTPSDEYADTRGQERLEKRLEIEETGNAAIGSYAWVNQEQGVVRIPVSQAATLVVDELNSKPVQVSSVPVPGTPAAEAALQSTTGGSTETGEAAPAAPEETAAEPESALDSDQEPGPLASEEASSAVFGDAEKESPSTPIDTTPADEDLVEEPAEATP